MDKKEINKYYDFENLPEINSTVFTKNGRAAIVLSIDHGFSDCVNIRFIGTKECSSREPTELIRNDYWGF